MYSSSLPLSRSNDASSRHSQHSIPFTDNRKFRSELHGIRGVAILLVISFHLFANGRVSGGIDVFLAITGFLAIPSLMRRAQSGNGWIKLTERFAGLARRLVVPLIPVLISVLIFGIVILPGSEYTSLFTHIRASGLFMENIQLLRSNAEYAPASQAASPLQHLWSTSIQMQFHLVMPFLLMAITLPAARLRINPRPVVLFILGALSVASFFYAWELQGINQTANYFTTFSRIWELTISGIVGLSIHQIALSPRVRGLLSWIGLAMICSAGFLIDGGARYPGPQALLPVGGILLVLIAGETRTRWGADRLLQIRPITFLADISYSLYLWHWPVIILYLSYRNADSLSPLSSALLLALSVLLGYLGKRLFEVRVAHLPLLKPPLPAVAIGVASCLILAGTVTALNNQHTNWLKQESLNAKHFLNDPRYPGAMTYLRKASPPPMPPVPYFSVAITEEPAGYALPRPEGFEDLTQCTLPQDSEIVEPVVCSTGPEDASHTIVFTGGSHVTQWWPAMERLAEQHGWNLVLVDRNACILTADRGPREGEPEFDPHCYEWNQNVIPLIVEMKPDLVVTLATTLRYEDGEGVLPGARDAWHQFNQADIPLLLLRDTPYPAYYASKCLEDGGTAVSCGTERYWKASVTIDEEGPGDLPSRTSYIDTSTFVCQNDFCPAIIGNVVVWQDDDHVSVAFAETAAPKFEETLRRTQPHLFH